MSRLQNAVLATSNVDSRYTASAQPKEKIEQIRLAAEKTNPPRPDDPAYTVEISDEARALSNQRNTAAGADAADSSSLFTKAGRAETAQQYDRVFANLLAEYDEAEAVQRFDDFMRSEGYERSDTENRSITAPRTVKSDMPTENGLFSHSYVNATVIDGKDHILAATWASYNASSAGGNHTYQKKLSDSFDLAADSRTLIKGMNRQAMNDGQSTDPQSEKLWSRLDALLEEASTTGSVINSTVTEEAFIDARERERDSLRSELVFGKVEKADIEKLRLAREKIDASKSGEARNSVASSLFTQAGRTETAQRYDQVLADLRANHDEDEVLKLFGQFMRSEGYETKDINEINIGAFATLKKIPSDSNLYSHSYLISSVIEEKEYILASTWATYSNGNQTWHKKIADGFDIAADATSVQNGKSIYGMLLDEEGYEAQNNALMSKVDALLEDASTNGNLIDSTATEEEFKNANQAAADWFNNNINAELTLESRVKTPDSEIDSTNDAPGKRWTYMDDEGALKMSSLDEIKARLQNTGEAPDSTRTNILRSFHNFIKRLQS